MGFFHAVKRSGREVDHHLHPVQRLRTGGPILLLPLHVFMVRSESTYFTFTFVPMLKVQDNGEIVEILQISWRNMCGMKVELH